MRVVEFVFTTASRMNHQVKIDSNILAKDYEERRKLSKPWWVIGAGAFLFKTKQGVAVALTKRKGPTTYSGKWALIPAGCGNNLTELMNPRLIVEREGREELKMLRNGIKLDPFEVSCSSSHPRVEIYDKANGKTNVDYGHIHSTERAFYFIRKYFVRVPLSELILYDGELYENKPLDRFIAVVLLRNLDKKEKSICLFKSKKRVKNTLIDLECYQTPTLEWARQEFLT